MYKFDFYLLQVYNLHKMTIDEGGRPTGGNLSDYVASRLPDITDNKANPSILSAPYDKQAGLLRAHLIAMTVPIEELFSRFQVRELLREVCSKYWQRSNTEELRPSIFEDIVIATNSFLLKAHIGNIFKGAYKNLPRASEPLSDDLLLQRVVGTRLEGYGFRAYFLEEGKLRVNEAVTYPTKGFYSGGAWPTLNADFSVTREGGDSLGRENRWDYEDLVDAQVSTRMTIMAISPEDALSPGYDLEYSLSRSFVELDWNENRSRFADFNGVKYVKRPRGHKTYVDNNRRITANQAPEDLTHIIGNDILKWLNEQKDKKR